MLNPNFNENYKSELKIYTGRSKEEQWKWNEKFANNLSLQRVSIFYSYYDFINSWLERNIFFYFATCVYTMLAQISYIC